MNPTTNLLDPSAEKAFLELPEVLRDHLQRRFLSAKTLTLAVLVVVHPEKAKALGARFKISQAHMNRIAASCLRILRQKKACLWDKEQNR